MRSFDEAKSSLLKAIDEHSEEIINLGEQIWRNPEPGYREIKTSRLAKEVLEQYQYSVTDGLAITGLRADLASGRPGPCVAILGEMDSLIMPNHPACNPVTGAVHACGHNSHLTAMLGAAIGFRCAGLQDDISGKLSFIATPAEEGGCDMAWRLKMIDEGKITSLSGKQTMILAGVFDDVDIAFMNHLANAYNASSGAGNIKKRIFFHGKSCHAAIPECGVNALNAMTHALNALGLIRERLNPMMRIHGIVSEGGTSDNIIPDLVVAEYYVRASTIQDMQQLNKMFDDAVHYSALAVGATANIRTIFGSLPVRNDRDMMKLLGHAVQSTIPAFNGEICDVPCSASTDMGDISQIMPAIHGYVPGAGGTMHGTDFHIADRQQAYVDAAKIEALMALEMLYGNAAEGQRIVAANRGKLLSREQYRQIFNSFNCNEEQ